eukprot:8923118-Alexandrium_andersonii.AAC.1
MELELVTHGDEQAALAGDMLAVAVDGYLRKQDLLQLLVEDVVDFREAGRSEIVLRLGRSSRGESVKTGRDQT